MRLFADSLIGRRIPSRRRLLVAAGFLLLPGVAAVQLEFGWELTFAYLYLLPIALVAWKGGRGAGVVASAVSATAWTATEVWMGRPYSSPAILWINGGIRLGFFLVVSWILVEFRRTLERERALSRADPLTGAANSRHFLAQLEFERDRALRYGHPLTIAYLDIDDFKGINDRFGHSVGDRVLKSVVRAAQSRLRDLDVVGRLGGDEFAILMPETDEDGARAAMDRVREALDAAMVRDGWPATFSAGMVTFLLLPPTPDDIIRRADEVMYRVKRSGKNALCHEVAVANG